MVVDKCYFIHIPAVFWPAMSVTDQLKYNYTAHIPLLPSVNTSSVLSWMSCRSEVSTEGNY